jgi:hypothetical protein
VRQGVDGAVGGNDSDGGSVSTKSGMLGCPGAIVPDRVGKFYLTGTKRDCNPATQVPRKKHHPLVPAVCCTPQS